MHGVGFITVMIYVNRLADPQAPLLWVKFAIVDWPISLIYYCFGEGYGRWLDSFGQSVFAQLLYPPHLIHGLLGTVWWYWLPRLLGPKTFGGVWGTAERKRTTIMAP